MPQVIISEENFERLQRLAVPLVDTADSVIGRALDALEGAASSETGSVKQVRTFAWSSPPDLSFTTVRAASVDGQVLPNSETYWNSLLFAVVRAAASHGATTNQIASNLLANHISGRKDDGGYKPVPGVGLSVQGQDANNAWKATAYLADQFGIKLEVMFSWQHNPKAALPGQVGRLMIGNTE